MSARAVTVTPAVLRQSPLPDGGGGKEARGRTLVVGGSAETPGGVLLAAEAALRCGAGKLQVATAQTVAPHVAVALPEAMVRGLPESGAGAIDASGAGKLQELTQDTDALLVGPGLADVAESAALAAALTANLDASIVLDALALAAITADLDCVRHLGGRAVLTPNPSELARCLDEDESWVAESPDRAATRLAERTGAVVSVGGGLRGLRRRTVGCGVTTGVRLVLACRVPGMSGPDWSRACWLEEPTPPRPPYGQDICTHGRVSGCLRGTALWASWRENFLARSRLCSSS